MFDDPIVSLTLRPGQLWVAGRTRYNFMKLIIEIGTTCTKTVELIQSCKKRVELLPTLPKSDFMQVGLDTTS